MSTTQSFRHSGSNENAISLSGVISAMTFALDLTEGAVAGHGLRSCLLGMRIAAELGLSHEMRKDLYYALQLKDAGCSANASRMTQILGGDDRAINAAIKLENWRKRGMSWRGMRILWRNTMPEAGLHRRLGRFFQNAREAAGNRKIMTRLRCERGAEIVRQLGLNERTAQAVGHVDEHWDGQGHPHGLCGTNIPLLSRICAIAQNLDIFAIEYGTTAAMAMLLQREGTWFDPEMVTVVERLNAGGGFWTHCYRETNVDQTREAVLALDPGNRMALDSDHIDRICRAFASVVDAKSPFTYRHSLAVTEVAVLVARELGLGHERVKLVRRAALLHDLGKLAVPNCILDKESKLTPEEWRVVKEHPGKTRSILERISAFRELATIASEHHEKMDGTGYPLGLMGAELSLESRILVVADMFTAMAEERPYTRAREPRQALEILRDYVPQKIDERCFDALYHVTHNWTSLMEVTPMFAKDSMPDFYAATAVAA